MVSSLGLLSLCTLVFPHYISSYLYLEDLRRDFSIYPIINVKFPLSKLKLTCSFARFLNYCDSSSETHHGVIDDSHTRQLYIPHPSVLQPLLLPHTTTDLEIKPLQRPISSFHTNPYFAYIHYQSFSKLSSADPRFTMPGKSGDEEPKKSFKQTLNRVFRRNKNEAQPRKKAG